MFQPITESAQVHLYMVLISYAELYDYRLPIPMTSLLLLNASL